MKSQNKGFVVGTAVMCISAILIDAYYDRKVEETTKELRAKILLGRIESETSLNNIAEILQQQNQALRKELSKIDYRS